MNTLLPLLYGLAAAGLVAFSGMQLSLLAAYLRRKQPPTFLPTKIEKPFVTVQLPIFNEKAVVERLLTAVVALDWPRERLEVQVLDDSTDATATLLATRVEQLQKQGFPIEHLRRSNRAGYKAGALQHGLNTAQGELIAIFDADFLPEPDFLQKTTAAFSSGKIGVVQARWGHLNASYSALTQAQAFGLDVHFTVEQGGRYGAGHFLNFNGTAGLWRRQCIDEAGGWRADTLTEDLDLSYRAQLQGWRFCYLEEVVAPAELPITMHALKQQQHRWMKGAATCARLHLRAVLKAPGLPLWHRLHAAFHLLAGSTYAASLGLALLSLPVWLAWPESPFLWLARPLQGLTLLLLGLYAVAFYRSRPAASPAGFAGSLLKFMLLSMGLSLHNALAVAEGWLGRPSPFMRTPKFNVITAVHAPENELVLNRFSPLVLAEALLCLYFSSCVLHEMSLGLWGLLPFHTLMAAGLGWVAVASLVEPRPIA